LFQEALDDNPVLVVSLENPFLRTFFFGFGEAGDFFLS